MDLNKYKLQTNPKPTPTPFNPAFTETGYKKPIDLSKYKTQATPEKSGFMDFVDNKAGVFGPAAGRTIIKTAKTMANAGEKVLQFPLKAAGLMPKDQPLAADQLIPEGLTRDPIGNTEKAGDLFGEVLQYATPMGAEKLTIKGTTLLSKLLAGSPKALGVAKVALKSAIGGTEFASKTAMMGGGKEEVKEAGIWGAATPPALKVANKAASFAFGDVAPAILSSMTGVAPDAIKAAFKNYGEVAKYMAKKVIPVEVRNQAIAALGKYRKKVGDTFEAGLKEMAKQSPRRGQARTISGPGFPGVFSGVKSQFDNLTQKGEKSIKNTFNKFRISVSGDKLNFDKLNSSIISPTERKQVQMVWDTIRNQKDFSAQGVQDVASRINKLAKFNDGVKTQSSAVIGAMHNMYATAIEKVYPKLGKLRKEYEISQKIIKGIDDIIKSSKSEVSNPSTATSVSKKLVNLFNEDNEAYIRALRQLEEQTGDDLVNQFVAANFDRIMPGKLGGYLGQAGVIAGSITGSPLLLAVLPLFSPKLVGKVTTTAGKTHAAMQQFKRILPNILK